MPVIHVNIEGKGGGFPEQFSKRELINVEDAIYIETLDAGMTSGRASVGIIIPLPDGKTTVLAQTSVRALLSAVAAIRGKYGDEG